MLRTKTVYHLAIFVLVLGLVLPAGAQDRVRGVSVSGAGADLNSRTALFGCAVESQKDADVPNCNSPGDFIACAIEQPLLCLTDIDAPTPNYVTDVSRWSGGVLALSDPVRGDALADVAAAHAICAQSFGADWRLADLADGSGTAIQGYGFPGPADLRAWVDSKQAPALTCWTR